MLRILALALAAAPLAVFVLACGDGPDVAPTPTATPTAIPTAAPTQTMPAPTIPDANIDAIYPEHGQQVTQASTLRPTDNRASGACVQTNFDGPAESAQWFRVVFDEEEVTEKLTLLFPANAETVQPEGATLCWAPEEGFTVGTHIVTVAVQDPSNLQGPTYQLIQWEFEVTP